MHAAGDSAPDHVAVTTTARQSRANGADGGGIYRKIVAFHDDASRRFDIPAAQEFVRSRMLVTAPDRQFGYETERSRRVSLDTGGEALSPWSARAAGRRRLSGLIKRSFSLAGHRTSVALEQEFWTALMHIAAERHQTLTALVAAADAERGTGRPLASALRVMALREFFPAPLTPS